MSARRERILDAARGVIVREGYPGVSMHAIARAAGITRPALYAEFDDRDAVFAALFDREQARVLAMAADATPTVRPDTDPEDLAVEVAEAAVEVYLDLVLSAPQTWQLVLMPGDGLPTAVHARIDTVRSEIRQRLAAAITMVAALRERTVDAELLSYAVISISETGARLLLADDTRREPIAATLRWLTRRMTAAALAMDTG
ncbi:TetR/AcrR family transcriptional regulator [Nocardia altamirensis]|uniref:TetR/AcrR family transcriptional regulator n=1 Tax=Nocardia altamirensis TaxID=472158 RepID=UPI00084076FA|nr:TetR/AcrR family transcriptional regulator [Nocardia altamirensis]